MEDIIIGEVPEIKSKNGFKLKISDDFPKKLKGFFTFTFYKSEIKEKIDMEFKQSGGENQISSFRIEIGIKSEERQR